MTAVKALALPASRYGELALLAVVLTVLPFFVGSFNLHLAGTVIAYGIAVLGLDLIVGRAGMLCFGQAVFFAVGAYASVVAMTRYHQSWLVGCLVALALAALLGALVALPAARLTGLSFGFVTFGLGAVCDSLLNGNLLQGVVGGSNGLFPPTPHIFGFNLQGDRPLYAVSAGLVIITGFLYLNLVHSSTGRAVETLRSSELVAQALGVPINRYRIGVTMFGAALAAVGGLLLAQNTRYVSPDSYSTNTSITLVAMLILGGRRSLSGPFVGAAFFVLLPQFLLTVQQNSAIIFSAILLVTLIFAPSGVVGFVRQSGAFLLRRSRHDDDDDVRGAVPLAYRVPEDSAA